MSFSKEPVVWITLAIVVLTAVSDVLTGNIDIGTAVNSVIAAIGGITARGLVSPAGSAQRGTNQ